MHYLQHSPRHVVQLLRRTVFYACRIAKTRPMAVIFYYRHSHANPYQSLLYASLPKDWLAIPLPIEFACILQRIFPGISYYFHLHWFTEHMKSHGQLQWLQRFRNKGGELVWTIHNIVSHESRYPEKEMALYGTIAAMADRIHLHYDAAVEMVTQHYQLPQDKIIIAPHGHYMDVLAPYLPTASEPGNMDTIRFFSGGILRGYKGIDELAALFATLHDHVKLVVAGSMHPTYKSRLESSGHIEYHQREQRISEQEFCQMVRGCHFTLLPYKNSLTSGIMLYSLSCGTPVIAPDYGHFSAILNHDNGILYAPDDPDGLKNAIHQACTLSAGDYQRMRKAALETAQRYPWERTTALIFPEIRQK